MANNKTVNRSSSKNVLDYDPLAWLGEEDDSEAADASAADSGSEKKAKKSSTKVTDKNKSGKKKSSKKKQAKKEAKQKKAKKQKTINDSGSEQTLSFESNESKLQQSEVQSEPESVGYGFFADNDSSEQSAAHVDDNEQEGYGFFDDAPQAGKQTTSSVEKDEEAGYGFFDDNAGLTTQEAKLDRDSNIISLGAELTIRSVSTFKALIDESLSNGFDIKLAAGELQKIDTAGLQLLLSLKNTLDKTAQSIHWENSNSVINEAAKIIGLPNLVESSEVDQSFGFFDDDKSPSNSGEQQTGYGFF